MTRLICLLILSCTSYSSYSQKAIADSVITKEILLQHVQTLAHDSMQGRYTGTPGYEKAAAYIASEMKNAGLLTLDRNDINYYHWYNLIKGKDTISAANIVGLLPGKVPDKIIIFSAHFDHVGDASQQVVWSQFNPTEEDKIYNGANDDASGVAAMLALSRYFKLLQENYYTILFIAFSGEEDGLLGSEAMARSFLKISNIVQVVNMEMLGRLSPKSKKPFITEGANSYGFTRKLNKNLRQMDPAVKRDFFIVDPYSWEKFFSRSDNYSFAAKGVPANTIMTTDGSDPFYHDPGDEWQTLDYDIMTKIVKAIALACTPLVQEIKEKNRK